MAERSATLQIQSIDADGSREFDDQVAIEEPLEIRLAYNDGGRRVQKSLSITMRTPGNDEELAVGFLITEGIIASFSDIQALGHTSPPVPEKPYRNVLLVALNDDVAVDMARLQRHFYTTSSCGVCGKASLEALNVQNSYAAQVNASEFRISSDALLAASDNLSSGQVVFGKTGGLHATGLFDSAGNILAIREDVGRHNALDKIIGYMAMQKKLPLSESGVIVSGRTSFELMQKLLMAGCPLMAAIGAPSSLAVELAREFNMTLIGFLRGGRFNAYAGSQRIILSEKESA